MQMLSKRKQLSQGVMKEVLLVTGPPVLLSLLEPWLAAKRVHFEIRIEPLYPEIGESLREGDPRLLGVSAFVLVGDRGPAPSKQLPGLGLLDANGRFVFGSQLCLSARTAPVFAAGAATVEERFGIEQAPGPAVLLGEWEPRARKMALRSIGCLSGAELPCFQWTADRVSREQLSHGLSTGLGFALYYGHGRSVGWAGYYGYRSRHLPDAPAEPMGAVFSITCSTASRGGSGLSFSERLVSRGVCAASLGATRKTRHLSNAYLASSLCEAIAGGANRVHHSLYEAKLPEDILYSSYRLFGDPTALLKGSRESEEQAALIYAPAPEEGFDSSKIKKQFDRVFSPDVVKEDVDLAELIGL